MLYSNRSAAYLKLNKLDEALKDGTKCTELDAQWAKGHTRKGDALYALKRYTDAYNAYNASARLATDAAVQEKMELAMRAIRNDTPSPSAAPAAASTSTTSTYLRMLILVLGAVYLIPFLPHYISSYAYRISCALYGARHLLDLIRRTGYPSFTSEYGMKIAVDGAVTKIFLGFMLAFSARPYALCMLPVLLSEGADYSSQLLAFLRSQAGSVEKLLPMLARLNPAFGSISVAQICAPGNATMAAQAMHRMAATFEVYQGIFLIVELFLPTRNFIQLYLWWQYLKLRYMQGQGAGDTKAAFKDVDQSLLGLLGHPYCPAILRTGYDMVKGLLVKQVAQPTAGGGAAAGAGGGGMGSMLSKCTIM